MISRRVEASNHNRKHETRCRETFGHAGGETDAGDQVAGGPQDEGEAGRAGGSRTRWVVMDVYTNALLHVFEMDRPPGT